MSATRKLFTATAKRKVRLPYLLYPPAPAGAPRERSPLVLFLHGMGERGDDLSLLTQEGLPTLAEAGRAFPFFIAAPQCPAGSTWVFELDALRSGDARHGPGGEWSQTYADQAVYDWMLAQRNPGFRL